MSLNDFRTPLAKVKGLGSAKSGTATWWAQRWTAVALIPLVIWFVVTVIKLVSFTGERALSVLQSPANEILFVTFMIMLLYHGFLGMREIIEDYVHCKFKKTITILLLQLTTIVTAISGILALIAFHIVIFS